MDNDVLILGIGNYLMGDEGVGVHVVQQLEAEGIEGADLLDGGTGGFHLLEYFEKYPHIIIIDATLGDNPTGTIRLIKPKYAVDFPPAMSTHDIGLRDLTTAIQLLGKSPDIYLYVVSIESIQQQGVELTPEIRKAAKELKGKVRKLVQNITNRTLLVVD